MELQSQTDRYVLVDGGIGHVLGIKDSLSLSGVGLRVVRSVATALGACGSERGPDLVLVGVGESNVDAISGCRELLQQHESSIIAFGPAQDPDLRARCFRAGAVDYLDVGASPKEVDLRIGMHLRKQPAFSADVTSCESHSVTGSRKHEIYHLTVKYLSQTEIGNISQQSLASRIGVSVGILDAAFRTAMGYSIARFLKRRRIDIAAMLLKGSNLSVTAIAELLGFSDGANFATAFRLHAGLTPSEYRDCSSEECGDRSGFVATDWMGDPRALQVVRNMPMGLTQS